MGKSGGQYLFFIAAVLSASLSPALYCAEEAKPISTASTVAILDLTKRNKESGVETVALKHSFEITGIPFIVTEDAGEAEKYDLIVTSGSLFNTTLSAKEVQSLYDYVETGGTLVSALAGGNKFFSLFGIDKPVASRKRFEIDFAAPSADKSLKYLDRKEEKRISLGNKKLFREIVWTQSFDVTDARALGNTEDNKVIFSVNEFGSGTAYALGIGYADAILLPHMGGDYEAQRVWINGFEPGSDVFVLILKAICENTFDTFVYKSTIPFGHNTALLLSHDVDAQSSFANSIDFAALEKSFGVRSTFFITTKYFADETDIGYYDKVRAGYIKKVKELGGDIGSHSVSHSKKFDSFAMGDSLVDQSGYKPLTKPTVFGELVVSKEILDRDLPNQNTIIFRAGELRVPESLFEALEKAGYLYDSSFSAGDNMTNFAYRVLERKNIGAKESPVIEIPVTFDDSIGQLRADNVDKMVGTWLDVIWANADNEAISTLLIHPSETGYKLNAEEKLLSALKGKDIWIGDVTSYADFWKKRLLCNYSVYVEKDRLIIRLDDDTIPAQIAFVVKYPPRIKSAEVRNRKGQKIDFLDLARGDKIFLWKKP